MATGRKPKPTALRLLQGNPGKRATNANEAMPDVEIPKVPDHITGEARKEWYRISKQLASVGLLTAIDRAALAAYCIAWGRWVEAERNIQKYGVVLIADDAAWPVASPYLAIANRAMEQMLKLLVEFGMSPSSRSRVVKSPSQQETDPMADMLSARRIS